jgi:hypothetical protein
MATQWTSEVNLSNKIWRAPDVTSLPTPIFFFYPRMSIHLAQDGKQCMMLSHLGQVRDLIRRFRTDRNKTYVVACHV